MNKSATLKSVIGTKKTLVIACNECPVTDFYSNRVITIMTQCNCVHPHDFDLKNEIKLCIERFECTQIVVMGHTDCKLTMLFQKNSPDTPVQPVKEKLIELASELHASRQAHETILKQCVELNVSEQVNILMEDAFITKAVASGELTVSGVLLDSVTKQVYELSRNGWNYNSIRSSN